VGTWRVAAKDGASTTLEANTVTAWTTDARSGPSGEAMNNQMKLDGTGSARVEVLSAGSVRSARSNSRWKSVETSRETGMAVSGSGSQRIVVERIGGR
jgi:hypothetical protein